MTQKDRTGDMVYSRLNRWAKTDLSASPLLPVDKRTSHILESKKTRRIHDGYLLTFGNIKVIQGNYIGQNDVIKALT